MTAITAAANDAFRDFAILGVPSSGEHEPVKSEVRGVFSVIDTALASLGVNGAITVKKATKAALDADLAHAADTLAVVYNDSTSSLNGIYAKSGGSGSGSWAITALALPSTFAADIAAVMASAEAAQAALTDALAIYGSMEAVEAAEAAAEAAALAAETAQTGAGTARDLAQQYAADAAGVSGVNVPIYASVASAGGATIVAGVKSIRTQYYAPTYADLSTLVGGAQYARVSLATITAAGYPALAYFRSVDRFMPDGTTDATNGGYWLISERSLCPTMFGAVGVYATDSTAAISACFDTVRVRGGGRVLWSAGVFRTTTTQLIPSNCHVQGAGRGATVIRPPAGALAGRTVNGLSVTTSLAMVGVQNSSVRGVSFDHRTNASTANGPAFIKAGGTAANPANPWDVVANTQSKNCVIDDCEILFLVNSQYMIWNFESSHNKITNNYLDGGITINSAGPQEGIECFGGRDVLIQGNTIKNIGGNGIYVATDTGFIGNSHVQVLDNYMEVCRVGVRVSVAVDSDHIEVRGNHVKDPWLHGIYGSVSAGRTLTKLDVLDNQVEGGVSPITFEAETGAFTKRVTLRGNDAEGGTGTYQAAISIARFQDLTLEDNTVDGAHVTANIGFGLSLEACTNFRVRRNTVNTCDRHGILLNECHDGVVSGNKLTGYNAANTESNGVAIPGVCSNIASFNNEYDPAFEDYAVYVTSASSDRIRIFDEILHYTHTFGATAFRNDGTNPNIGSVTSANGATTTTVTNTLAREGSRIVVWQKAGTIRPFRLTQGDGTFSIITAAADGSESYGWDIRS